MSNQQQTRNADANASNHRRPRLQEQLTSFFAVNEERPAGPSAQVRELLQSANVPLGSTDLNDSILRLASISPEMTQTMSNLSFLTNPEMNFNFNIEDYQNNKGIPESDLQIFLDALDRVDRKKLKKDDCCPICTNDYLSDDYPLVVTLPCNAKHHFDLDCIAPWLKANKTCPICRADVTAKKDKKLDIPIDEEEEEEDWELYG